MAESDYNPHFQYAESLAKKETPHIRWVEMLPDLNIAGCVDIKLHTYEFDEGCPTYNTLSYVWGSPENTSTFQCNGCRLRVTKTLHQALRDLYDPDSLRLWWIDQITINQCDDEEKTQQVAMMREIYERSDLTIAYLGPSDPFAVQAFTTLEGIVKAVLAGSPRRHDIKPDFKGLSRLLFSRELDAWDAAQPTVLDRY